MNKHEDLVRGIAEEMAAAQYNDLFATFEILPPGTAKSFIELTTGQKEMMIVRTLPAARVAVKHMADISEDAITWADLTDDIVPSNIYLKERGLISDDTANRKAE